MKVNLYDALSVIGQEKGYDVEPLKQQVVFHGDTLTIESKKPFQVTICQVEKELLRVCLELTVAVTQACSRCLCDVVRDYDLSIDRMIDMTKKAVLTDKEDEFDEISYIEDCELDVDLLILDELYTVLPMTVLCSEDCKGICKVCGTNLNRNTCECDQTVPDPRMAVFGDVFNQFKEV